MPGWSIQPCRMTTVGLPVPAVDCEIVPVDRDESVHVGAFVDRQTDRGRALGRWSRAVGSRRVAVRSGLISRVWAGTASGEQGSDGCGADQRDEPAHGRASWDRPLPSKARGPVTVRLGKYLAAGLLTPQIEALREAVTPIGTANARDARLWRVVFITAGSASQRAMRHRPARPAAEDCSAEPNSLGATDAALDQAQRSIMRSGGPIAAVAATALLRALSGRYLRMQRQLRVPMSSVKNSRRLEAWKTQPSLSANASTSLRGLRAETPRTTTPDSAAWTTLSL